MHILPIDPIIIGLNISTVRRRKKIKALDIARALGMSESNYTKYERGVNELTLNFINNVAQFLKVDPLLLLTSTPDNIIENIHDSLSVTKDNKPDNFASEIFLSLVLQLKEKDNQIKSLLDLLPPPHNNI